MNNMKTRMPMVNTPERAEAQGGIYRLAAAAFGHPLPEFQQALENGSFHEALSTVWFQITGRQWPPCPVSADFAALESGYIDTFTHGRAGKPRVPLLAGEYGSLIGGLTRPVFMLNIQAFYRHFGLQAATGDEGESEEPDHLVAMLEFMAVLSHLEAQALQKGKNPSAYRRAQRDFLKRYLLPLVSALHQGVASEENLALDATLTRLIEDLPEVAQQQCIALEADVGPYNDQTANIAAQPRVVEQNLWS